MKFILATSFVITVLCAPSLRAQTDTDLADPDDTFTDVEDIKDSSCISLRLDTAKQELEEIARQIVKINNRTIVRRGSLDPKIEYGVEAGLGVLGILLSKPSQGWSKTYGESKKTLFLSIITMLITGGLTARALWKLILDWSEESAEVLEIAELQKKHKLRVDVIDYLENPQNHQLYKESSAPAIQ